MRTCLAVASAVLAFLLIHPALAAKAPSGGPPQGGQAAAEPKRAAPAAKTPADKKAAPDAKPVPEKKAAPAPQAPDAKPPDAKAPEPPPQPKTPAEALRDDLDRIFAETASAKATVAARIIALGDPPAAPPEVLYAARADAPLVPASTMKLVVTAACFDRFGPDWRLRTHVGRIPSTGQDAKWDLAVIGGGDPNFSGRFWGGDIVGAFQRWADVLKARGITAIGRVVLDDSLFDGALQHPRWPADQRAEWYEAPVSALVLNDSCINIHILPGKAGEPALVTVEPPGSGAAVDGVIQTAAERGQHSYSIERIVAAGPGAAVRLRVAGRFWSGDAETVEYRTVASPTMYFGSVLAEALRAEGITVAGPVARERLTRRAGRARPDFECDVIHTSRLDVTAGVANKRSQGLYAECLMKLLGAYGPAARAGEAAAPAAGAVLPPRQGTWANGAEEARLWLSERGIPLDGCVIDDGSGLSKENRLTALAVTELLRVMRERHGDGFVQTLAAAGQEGSLAKRLRGTAAEGRVWGKTGYVLGTSALSGYVRARSGRMIVFSILMNDVPWGELWKARLAQDKVCLRLVEY
jgi:D-alanyl-D-alanine carboxypeptidase/D-alanyl-D-alanine-endopeptidase (penicillin-binding protein 4)